MDIDNDFEVSIAALFTVSFQLGGLRSQSQDNIFSFCLGEQYIFSHNSTPELFRRKVDFSIEWKNKTN